MVYVQFLLSSDVVAVWSRQRRAGNLPVGSLMRWLMHPTWDFELANKDLVITFGLDTGVILTIPQVTRWPIAKTEQARLLHWLQARPR